MIGANDRATRKDRRLDAIWSPSGGCPVPTTWRGRGRGIGCIGCSRPARSNDARTHRPHERGSNGAKPRTHTIAHDNHTPEPSFSSTYMRDHRHIRIHSFNCRQLARAGVALLWKARTPPKSVSKHHGAVPPAGAERANGHTAAFGMVDESSGVFSPPR